MSTASDVEYLPPKPTLVSALRDLDNALRLIDDLKTERDRVLEENRALAQALVLTTAMQVDYKDERDTAEARVAELEEQFGEKP